MRIGGIVDTSTVDWYGNVTLMIFAAGCNFRCPYCQNSMLIPADSGKEVPMSSILERIETSRFLLDAVGVTGGEPTLQPRPLGQIYESAKSQSLKTMLDTNGSRPDVIQNLCEKALLDHIALDIKAPLDAAMHRPVIGVNNCADTVRRIRRSLDVAAEFGTSLEVRTTVVPGLTDEPIFIEDIAREVKDKTNLFYLQQFNPQAEILDPSLKTRGFPTRETLVQLAYVALKAGVKGVYVKTKETGLEEVLNEK